MILGRQIQPTHFSDDNLLKKKWDGNLLKVILSDQEVEGTQSTFRIPALLGLIFSPVAVWENYDIITRKMAVLK